jgi:signal transduction histidine kinase
MRAGVNTIDVKVVGEPLQAVASRQRAAGLSAMQLGRFSELAPLHARRHLLQVTLPQTASAMLLVVGVFTLLIGGLKRAHSHLAYFGAFAIGWGLVGARLWWRELPLSGHAADVLLVSFMPFVVLAGILFVLRYAGDAKRRWIDAALYVQCAVVPPTLLLAGAERLYPVAIAWHLWTLWQRQRKRFWPMATLLLGALALVGLEFVAQQHPAGDRWQALSHALLPAAIVAMGLYLMRESGRALRAAEADRQTLEARVREAAAQIERNYAQLAELRVEQVTQQERKRIAADLHDDLGAKLLTIVHTSDNDRISALAREALEEMRLSVRGLTGKPVRLLDALGDWRAEVVSRLAQTGIEADWTTAVEDGEHTLSARVYVQTTRILREAVNNIIKHSGASRCAVHVALDGGQFEMTIQDNGHGIPLELDGRLDRGHGMASMKHRAKQMQGQCLVESGPGYGTVIRLTLPLERAGTAT